MWSQIVLSASCTENGQPLLFHHGAEPVHQKYHSKSRAYSKNEQCSRLEVHTVAAAAHVTCVNEAALSEVEACTGWSGCTRWSVGGLVTLLVPHSAHEAPEGNEVCQSEPIRCHCGFGEVCG